MDALAPSVHRTAGARAAAIRVRDLRWRRRCSASAFPFLIFYAEYFQFWPLQRVAEVQPKQAKAV